MRTIIIPFGPPGVGKGTQAALLAKTLSLPHISSGDLFRENVKNNTPLGERIKAFLDAGKLCDDATVIDLILDRISRPDCEKGFILDGTPRTVAQAKILDEKFANDEVKIVYLKAPEEELVRRISGRLFCAECGASFHKEYHPPRKEGLCDKCGGALLRRPDDAEEVVKERLRVYNKETSPLIAYYGERMHPIEATGAIDDIQNALRDCL